MISPKPAVFGTHDPNTLAQLHDVASRAEAAALMADGHKGYVMPNGGVAAYRDQVSVVRVGFDIACGNAAIRTDRTVADYTNQDLSRIADEIQSEISFGIGRTCTADDAPVDSPLFESTVWAAVPGKHEQDRLKVKARAQLGTVGSRNHYVDVFADELGRIWVGVHFGSRGFGHTVASGFLALGQNRPSPSRLRQRSPAPVQTRPYPPADRSTTSHFPRRRRHQRHRRRIPPPPRWTRQEPGVEAGA